MDAPSLIKHAREVLLQKTSGLEDLEKALECLKKAHSMDHCWSDGGIAVLRIWYNLTMKFHSSGHHGHALTCTDYSINRLHSYGDTEKVLTNSESLGPLILLPTCVPATGKDFCTLYTWALCIRSKSMASLAKYPQALKLISSYAIPWVVHSASLDPSSCSGMAMHILQALHACVSYSLKLTPDSGGMALPSNVKGAMVDSIQLLTISSSPTHLQSINPTQYHTAWGVSVLSMGVTSLQSYTTEVAAACPDPIDVPDVVAAMGANSTQAPNFQAAHQMLALGCHLLGAVLAYGKKQLSDAVVNHIQRLIGISTWLGHYHFWMYGLRLLCAHHKHAISSLLESREGNALKHVCQLMACLNEMARLLTFLGYTTPASRVCQESQSFCREAHSGAYGVCSTPKSKSRLQWCDWDVSITSAYHLCEQGMHAEARNIVRSVYTQLHHWNGSVESTELKQGKQNLGRLKLRCTYYLSFIHFKSGMFDSSLPLAEDCLSCSPLRDRSSSSTESWNDYHPAGFAEYAEIVDAFFHVITIYHLMGCTTEAQYYLDQVKKICYRGLGKGEWVVSHHYITMVALVSARLFKTQHLYTQASDQLYYASLLQWNPSPFAEDTSTSTLIMKPLDTNDMVPVDAHAMDHTSSCNTKPSPPVSNPFKSKSTPSETKHTMDVDVDTCMHQNVDTNKHQYWTALSSVDKCGMDNIRIHLHLRCCLEYGDVMTDAGCPRAALLAYSAARNCCVSLDPPRYLSHISDMLRYVHVPQGTSVRFDSFEGHVSKPYPVSNLVDMYIGCAMMKMEGRFEEGMKLLQVAVPLVEDLSLPKSIGYYVLGVSHWNRQCIFDSWMMSLHQSNMSINSVDQIDNRSTSKSQGRSRSRGRGRGRGRDQSEQTGEHGRGVQGRDMALERQRSADALQESYRQQQHLLAVPEAKKICLALGAVYGRTDPVASSYYLNMALGNTLRHQLSSSVIATMKQKMSTLNTDPKATKEAMSHILHSGDEERTKKSTAAGFLDSLMDRLPPEFCVCTMCVSEDGKLLYCIRIEYNHPAAVMALPLEGSNSNALLEANSAISAILQQNRKVCETKTLTKEEKKNWWRARTALDAKLGKLLEQVEVDILGCWRGLLLGSYISHPVAKAFDGVADGCLQHLTMLVGEEWPEAVGIQVDLGLVRSLLLGIVTSLLNGTPQASDSKTWQEMAIDGLSQIIGWEKPLSSKRMEALEGVLKGVQEAVLKDVQPLLDGQEARQHTVLILDGSCNTIPWESIPILSARSISRVPSLYYLYLQLGKLATESPPSVLRDGLDLDNVYYLLNPDQDLAKTQERFQSWFEGQPQWRGIVAARPKPQELQEELQACDMFLYFGHGSGERYLSKTQIRLLERCGVALLMGCSSGKLTATADLDPKGASLNFLLAGSPCVLSTLWDVTDKDIDKISEALLRAFMQQGDNLNTTTCLTSESMLLRDSICDILASSRGVCKLPFLTGAAVVCYGLPVYGKANKDAKDS